MGVYQDTAMSYADRASMAEGQDEQAQAIGSGLAAVAYALLELADKIDDIRVELAQLRTPPRR